MRPAARSRLLGIVGLSLAFGACASVTAKPDAPPSRLEARVAQHRLKAEALERNGDLRMALNEWTIALTIDPDDADVRANKAKLKARIEETVSQRIGQGREARRRGAQLEARRHFLAALALDPANGVAFDALQRQVKDLRFVPNKVRGRETTETIALPVAPPREEAMEVNPLLLDAREAFEQKEYQVALADVNRLLEGSPRHAQAIDLKKASLYEYGKSQLDQQQHAAAYRTLVELAKLDNGYRDSASLRRQARARLTQDLYNEGIRRYREADLEGAIALWRVVLTYDPDHADAKRNIEQAERVLKALDQRLEEEK